MHTHDIMLYDIGFFLFSLFYLPALLFKGKLHRDFLERFGLYDEETRRTLASGKDRIWIQAVSVGEVSLLRTLIPLLKNEFPGHEIVLSTITKAGNVLAKKTFSKDVTIIYFPLDFRYVIRKVVGLIKPKLYIMVETEIWPNLLKMLAGGCVLSVLINGRISNRSIGKYRLARPFLRNTLNRIDKFCMQTKVDAERIIEIGAPSERVEVTGNMKFDLSSKGDREGAQDIKNSLGLAQDDELLVAGSTHQGEEEILLTAFKDLHKEFPRLKLLIAPRHIDRVGEIEALVKKFELGTIRVSRCQGVRVSEVLLLDTIGSLNDIYSAATIVFIGGSLVRHGGHNPIEAAIFERAILFGPHMFNFRDIASLFLQEDAAVEVRNGEELFRNCEILLKDPSKRSRLGRRAREIVSKNRGATLSNIEAIKTLMGRGR